jgi:outer membrane protein assembly factor BamB
MPGTTDTAARRLALLIAASDYTDPALRQLRSPGRDAGALAVVLGDKRIGGFDVQTLINAPFVHVQEGIEEFCSDRRPDDQLLIYLSCHGVLDDHGRLYYASVDTRRQRLAASAVSSAWLNERLEDCRARSQILVLDCCHSGAFARGAKSDDRGDGGLALQQRFESSGRGRVVLTASRGTEYSFEGDQLSGEGVPSVFTHAIVDGLQTGDADRDKDGRITVTDLYTYVHDRVREAEPRQTPELWTFGGEGDLLVARSVRGPVVEPAPLPEDLRVTLESPRLRVRESGIAELAALLDTAGPGLALTARQMLQQVAEEDVPRLADLARAALGASAGDAGQEVEQKRAQGDRPPDDHRRWTWRRLMPRSRPGFIAAVGGAVLAVIASVAIVLALTGTPHRVIPNGWPHPGVGAIFTRPFVVSGFVYVGSNDGHVYALNADNGALIWKYPRKGQVGAVDSRPQASGPLVYVGSDDHYVYALNSRTGARVWRFKTEARVRSSPLLAGGTVFVGSDDGNLYALRADDGALMWSLPLGGPVESSPVFSNTGDSSTPLDDRMMYVVGGGYFWAINPGTRAVSWRYWLGGLVTSRPVVSPDNTTVYVGGAGYLYAFNAKHGRLEWKQAIVGVVAYQPAIYQTAVYVGSGDIVYAVKLTGGLYWQSVDLHATVSGPVAANGAVYVGSGSDIYCLDASSGQPCEQWPRAYPADGPVSTPVVNNGKIYFGTQEGDVYALTPSGTLARTR